FANAITAAPANSISVDIEPVSNLFASNFSMSSATLGSALNVTGLAGGSLAFSGATLTNTSGVPTAIHNVVNLTINGAITQTGSNGDLSKDGAGTLTLAGAAANTFT